MICEFITFKIKMLDNSNKDQEVRNVSIQIVFSMLNGTIWLEGTLPLGKCVDYKLIIKIK